jgi:hypothetical protein
MAIFLLCDSSTKADKMKVILKNKGSIAYGLEHSTHCYCPAGSSADANKPQIDSLGIKIIDDNFFSLLPRLY